MKKSKKVMTFIITMLLSCSFMLGVVYAATDSATLNWTQGDATAKEVIKIEVALSTINSPKYTYTKSGTNGMYQGVWLTFNGISNTTSKKVSGDTATYKVEATPQWINSNKQIVTQTKKTATFVYEGGFN